MENNGCPKSRLRIALPIPVVLQWVRQESVQCPPADRVEPIGVAIHHIIQGGIGDADHAAEFFDGNPLGFCNRLDVLTDAHFETLLSNRCIYNTTKF